MKPWAGARAPGGHVSYLLIELRLARTVCRIMDKVPYVENVYIDL